MDMDLLKEHELPAGFVYPAEFMQIIEQNLIDLEPWNIMSGEDLRWRNDGLKQRYPTRGLIPFAKRWDNDDIACWDPRFVPKVLIIHDFASPGYEDRRIFSDFWAWFKSAINDLIEHNKQGNKFTPEMGR
jgi:hypothetical protein